MSQMPAREKLYVRFSTKDDTAAISEFYKDNKHPFVFQRDPDIVAERAASGAVTLIEDEKGRIVASSISYPIVVSDGNGNDVQKWTEIGSTRIALEGAGVFKALISTQIARAFLLEPPDDRFVLEIFKDNERSTNVFKKLGAVPFSVPDELVKTVSKTLVPTGEDANVIWYQLGPDAMPGLAKNVIECLENPILRNKQTGQEYELDFSRCPLGTLLRPALDKLAGIPPDESAPAQATDIRTLKQKFGL